MVTDSLRCKALAGKDESVSVNLPIDGELSPSPSSKTAPAFVVVPEDVFCQSVIIPSAASGFGLDPQGPAAWYPDIRAFNISTGVKLTPGYGEAHAKCGTPRFKIMCGPNPEHYQTIARENCKRPACPSCWKGWATRQTKSAAEAVEGYKVLSGSKYDARHISIHPPKEALPDFENMAEALQWLNDESRDAAKMLGVTAAISFPHPYRIKPEYEAAILEAAGKDEMKRYEWALSQPNWEDLVYFSPHMHIIAFGHLLNSEEFFKKTGWTYKNHDEDTKGRSGPVLRQTIYYLLTHAWVNGNHKVARRWFGMSTHNMKRVEDGFALIPVLCPSCHADCVITPPDIVWADGSTHPVYQDLANAPLAKRKELYFHYEARPKKTRRKPAVTSQTVPQMVIV